MTLWDCGSIPSPMASSRLMLLLLLLVTVARPDRHGSETVSGHA